jgi:hypothetical protein
MRWDDVGYGIMPTLGSRTQRKDRQIGIMEDKRITGAGNISQKVTHN